MGDVIKHVLLGHEVKIFFPTAAVERRECVLYLVLVFPQKTHDFFTADTAVSDAESIKAAAREHRGKLNLSHRTCPDGRALP